MRCSNEGATLADISPKHAVVTINQQGALPRRMFWHLTWHKRWQALPCKQQWQARKETQPCTTEIMQPPADATNIARQKAQHTQTHTTHPCQVQPASAAVIPAAVGALADDVATPIHHFIIEARHTVLLQVLTETKS
jgi:hypothetical protein